MFTGLVLTVTVSEATGSRDEADERRGRAVRKSVLLANSVAEPRGERAAAEDEVADPQRGIVRVAVRHRERKPREVFGVRLVGRDDLFLQSRPILRHLAVDPLERHLRFPSGQHFLHQVQRALRVKIADDAQLGVRAADLRFVKRLDLIERDVLGAVERFLEGRHITHVIARVRRQARLSLFRASAAGSVRPEESIDAMRSFEVSNSSAGKAGSRRISRKQPERLRQRVAFGFDGERQLPCGAGSPAAAATAATTATAAAATRSDADARATSSSSRRAWRLCFFVPAIIRPGSIPAAVVWPLSDSSLP